MTTSIRGLSHLALRVTDLARARAFYVDALQFPVQVEMPGGLLLNAYGTPMAILGDDSHTAKSDRFNPYRVGLDHLALNVPNEEMLSALLDKLNQAGIPNHGIEQDEMTHARYISFYDPDGIAWEFYVTPARGA
jgi:catechol 2,3-dioxygenase-like lactoylglutathione lyase family enzyme